METNDEKKLKVTAWIEGEFESRNADYFWIRPGYIVKSLRRFGNIKEFIQFVLSEGLAEMTVNIPKRVKDFDILHDVYLHFHKNPKDKRMMPPTTLAEEFRNLAYNRTFMKLLYFSFSEQDCLFQMKYKEKEMTENLVFIMRMVLLYEVKVTSSDFFPNHFAINKDAMKYGTI